MVIVHRYRTGQQEDSCLTKTYMCSNNKQINCCKVENLNISCLNVCGLKRKLLFPEFQQLVTDHDIFICIETKIDDLDILNLPDGYCEFHKNRKKFKKKSGGIAVIFKENLRDSIKFLDSDSEFVLWFTIKKGLNNCDLLVGCVYIPPENSKYSDNEVFDEIENEHMLFKSEQTYSALVGDFNARTSILPDYIVPNDDLVHILNIDNIDELHNFMYEFEKLNFYKIPLERCSEDNGRCNSHGYRLLTFCKNNNFFIANGRIGFDKDIGKATSHQKSLIDYLIVSPDLFPFVSEFDVIDFNPIFSDVHCRLHFKLSMSSKQGLIDCDPVECVPKPKRWVADKKTLFNENIESKVNLDEMINNLTMLDPRSDSYASDLNDFVLNLNKLYLDSAHDVFGSYTTRRVNPRGRDKFDQPWFSDLCREKRKKFHDAKKMYNSNRNDENKRLLMSSSKAYRSEMNRCYNDFQFKLESDLRDTYDSNASDIWKILNKLHSSSKRDIEIPLDELYEYFKNMNTFDEQNDDDFSHSRLG